MYSLAINYINRKQNVRISGKLFFVLSPSDNQKKTGFAPVFTFSFFPLPAATFQVFR